MINCAIIPHLLSDGRAICPFFYQIVLGLGLIWRLVPLNLDFLMTDKVMHAQKYIGHVLCEHWHFDEIGSTNTALMQAIQAGEYDYRQYHLMTADRQFAGRGQHGRSWVGTVGNVFLSLYIPMQTVLDQPSATALCRLSGMLSLAVGYHLAQMPSLLSLNQYRRQQNLPIIGVKWANDLGYYDDNKQLFQKLAGILIEPVYTKHQDKSTCVGVIVGVGLNVASTPQITDGLYQATSMADLCQSVQMQMMSLPQWHEQIADAILAAIVTHNQLTKPSDRQAFVHAFNQVHLLTDKWVQIFTQDQTNQAAHQGKCVGIDEQGALLLDEAGLIVPIYAGMVQSLMNKDNQ